MPPRAHFVNNRDLLKEIHLSKASYNWYADNVFRDFDAIVEDLDEVDADEMLLIIDRARKSRAKRLTNQRRDEAKARGVKPTQVEYKNLKVEPESIPVTDLVIRVMTWEHIPLEQRVKEPKKESQRRAKVPFPPFKHYVFTDEDGADKLEVGRSHWKGDLKTGRFSADHGKITNKLARMFIHMTDRFSLKPNYRNYSFLEEMKGEALLVLCDTALQFEESRSENPFSFYTVTMTNEFSKVLNREKRGRGIRDDLIEMARCTMKSEPKLTRNVE